MSLPQTDATSILPASGSAVIYGCGGGGINLAKRYDNVPFALGIADVKTAYIDTSASNLEGISDVSTVYTIEGCDGSGKKRDENAEVIVKSMPRILKDLPPGQFNIVVFTASGGSGSVIGPVLVAELIARGLPVVCIVLGSEESAITAYNTFYTLKGLDNTARTTGTPVVMAYFNKTADIKRSAVDKEAHYVISALTYLVSRQNKELDTRDVIHLFNYSDVKAVTVTPQLTLLKVYDDREKVDLESPEAFSLGCLLKSEDEAQPKLFAQYSCAGYYRPGVEASTNLFFAVETHGLGATLTHLQQLSATINENEKARIEGPAFSTGKEQTGPGGLMFG